MLTKDLKNPFSRQSSVKPQTSSGTTAINGDWVDLTNTIGPALAVVHNGSATGTPDAQAHAVKMQEADDDSGTGAADITGATATITADEAVTEIQAKNRSKRYVRIVVTPAWTGGTSPTNIFSGVVTAQKDKY